MSGRAAIPALPQARKGAGRVLLDARGQILPPLILVGVLVLSWEAIVRGFAISKLVLPPPSAVIVNFFADAPFYLKHFSVTAIEVLIGLLAAVVLGCSLGFMIAFSRTLGSAIYPVIVGAQVTPKIAIAPLLLIWFGFGMTPKIILTALISFFPIVISMIVGLNATRREQLYLFRSMGATRVRIFTKLLLPGALPVLFGGLKVAATLSVIGAVIGEFTSATSGLGYVLMFSVGTLDTTAALAAVFYLVILGLLVFACVILAERGLIPAHMRRRMEETSKAI